MSKYVYDRLVELGAPSLSDRPWWRYTIRSVEFDDINPAVVYVEEQTVRRGPWYSSKPREVWEPIGQGFPVVTAESDLRPLQPRDWGILFATAASAAFRSAERATGMRMSRDFFEGSHP